MTRCLATLLFVTAACQPPAVERCEPSVVPERAEVRGHRVENCREFTVQMALADCAKPYPILPLPNADATHLDRTTWDPDKPISYEACLAVQLASRIFDTCPWEPDVKLVYPRSRRPE